jgi:hypothetical protein
LETAFLNFADQLKSFVLLEQWEVDLIRKSVSFKSIHKNTIHKNTIHKNTILRHARSLVKELYFVNKAF